MDPLYDAVPGKAYYAISFRDIPETYILGGRCIMCRHVGPVDRHRIEKRFGAGEQLRWVGFRYLRCLACGNPDRNHFTVVGCYLTVLLPSLPARPAPRQAAP